MTVRSGLARVSHLCYLHWYTWHTHKRITLQCLFYCHNTSCVVFETLWCHHITWVPTHLIGTFLWDDVQKSTGLNKHFILSTMGSSHLCRVLTLFYKELLLDSTLKIGISRWGLSKAALSSWFQSRRSRRSDETGKERRITCINTFLFSHYSLVFLTEYTQYNVVTGFS